MKSPALQQEAGASRPAGMPVLLLAYPLLVHLAVVWRAPLLEWLALVLLCAIPQFRSLRAGQPGNWLLLLVLAALLYALVRVGGGMVVLFIQPVLIPATLAAVFAGSLRRGQVPLVTRMAQMIGGPLEPEGRVYTRQVTWLWVWVLGLLAATDLGLALFAAAPAWSLFSNFLSYVLVGLVFVIEYGYRRLRFPTHDHPAFIEYMRRVVRTDYRAV